MGLLCVILLVAFLFREIDIRSKLESFNKWVAEIGTLGILLFILGYIAAAVLFLPGSILTLGAGFAFGIGWGMIAVSLGSTLGAGAAFLVARYLARDWVRKRLAKKNTLRSLDNVIGEQGWKIVFLLRLSPVFPFNALNYILGLTGVRFWGYFLATWIGMLPGAFLYVYLGYAGRSNLEASVGGAETTDILRLIYLGIGLLATLAVTIYVTRLARNALKQKTDFDSEPLTETTA